LKELHELAINDFTPDLNFALCKTVYVYHLIVSNGSEMFSGWNYTSDAHDHNGSGVFGCGTRIVMCADFVPVYILHLIVAVNAR